MTSKKIYSIIIKMRKVRRLGVSMLVAFVLMVLITVPSNLYLHSLLPQTEGVLRLPLLYKSVKVYRDKYDIPHIYAQNMHDAQIALGFVTASERLFQMDINRRIAAGRLSEFFGDKTVKIDILLRKLRLYKTMEDFWKKNKHKMPKPLLARMDNYLAGVKFYVDNFKLPIEYKLLGTKPEPFNHVDMLAISGYISLSFAEGLIADSLFTDLYASFPKELVDQLTTKERMHAFKEGKDFFTKLKGMDDTISALAQLEQQFGLFHGSNAWVLSGGRSKSGKPLLASDPHIAFSSPGVWYEAHVKTPDYESYGHYLPLVPFPVLNHNRFGGYGVTISEQDDFDLYEEKINPKNPNEVMYKGKWTHMLVYDEIIKVKGKKEIRLKMRVTPHGPLIDGTDYGVKGKHISLKWSYYHPENNIAMALYKLSNAKTMEECFEAISYAATPGLNFVWADAKGNIGWHVMGKIPLRPHGKSGYQILNGWSGKDEYIGYLPFKDNPHLTNPSSGVIVSTNFKPQNGSFSKKYPLYGYWQPQDRFMRVHKLLSKQKKWDLNGLQKVQTDRTDDRAKELIPVLLNAVRNINFSLAKQAKDILAQWDRVTRRESPAPAIYYKWISLLMERALKDDLGQKRYTAYKTISDFWYALYVLVKDPQSKWWDIKDTKKVENRDDILRISFLDTLKFMKHQFGAEITDWKWGRMHTIEYQHFFGRKKPLNYFFNVGPFPAAGAFSMVDNMSQSRGTDNFKVTRGPSTRRLIDFADPQHSLGILPTGNSGLPYSPYYDDQAQMFLDGKYRPQLMDWDDIKKGVLLELHP